MSVRTQLIEAKVAGNLQKVACDLLSEHIKSYADYCDFCDCMEKEAFLGGASEPMKNLMIGAGVLGAMAGLGGSHLMTKSHHKKVLQDLLMDPQFPDQNKVREIFNMISRFAPQTLSNSDYAKMVMVQLYNSPMVTPDMVQKVVEIENKVKGEGGSSIPGLDRISKTIKGIRG